MKQEVLQQKRMNGPLAFGSWEKDLSSPTLSPRKDSKIGGHLPLQVQDTLAQPTEHHRIPLQKEKQQSWSGLPEGEEKGRQLSFKPEEVKAKVLPEVRQRTEIAHQFRDILW